MYAGAGSAPLLAAAASWERLAAQWSSVADSYQATVSELAGESWRGPSSAAMLAAVKPYAAWMHAMAAHTAHTADQARAAAAAYQEAFAATVPPPVVAANRAALTSLVAGNVMGRNAAAIAANHAEYEQMWAQDAAAMHTYAARSAAAAALAPYPTPPQTTGSAAQTDAAAATPGPLTRLAQQIVANPTVEALNKFLVMVNSVNGNILGDGLIEGELQYMMLIPAYSGAATAAKGFAGALGLVPAAAGAAASAGTVGAVETAGAVGTAGAAGPAVAAGFGRAMPIGGLSAPPSWVVTAAEIRLAAMALPANPAGLAAAAEGGLPGGLLAGMPPVAGVVNAPGGGSAAGLVISPLTRESGAAGAAHRPRDGQCGSSAAAGPASEADDRSLAELRRTVAELTRDCELLEDSAETLLRAAGVAPAPPGAGR